MSAIAISTNARIDQSSFVPLGNLEQWISIRGEDRSNPVLLVVHGGPGKAQWPQTEVYKPWERAFTVVQWDQRGAGHTYGLRSQAAELKAREPEQFKNLEDGMQFTGEHVLPDQIATDLPKTACDIHTAYFVIQGRDDVITPTQAAVEYFKCVKAPKKELILIPNAGHFALMTASHEFLQALISKVRPIAVGRGA